MQWQTIRSWRDPGFVIPVACAALAISGIAALCNAWTHHYLAALDAQAAADPRAAAADAEHALLSIGTAVCGFSFAASLILARGFALALREQRLPPSGWWSLGALRVAVGPDTQLWCRIGLALAALLAIAGAGCLLAILYLTVVL